MNSKLKDIMIQHISKQYLSKFFREQEIYVGLDRDLVKKRESIIEELKNNMI